MYLCMFIYSDAAIKLLIMFLQMKCFFQDTTQIKKGKGNNSEYTLDLKMEDVTLSKSRENEYEILT